VGALAGLAGVAYMARAFKNRDKNMKISVYVIHTRMLAQMTVVGEPLLECLLMRSIKSTHPMIFKTSFFYKFYHDAANIYGSRSGSSGLKYVRIWLRMRIRITALKNKRNIRYLIFDEKLYFFQQ
jgi:hypothetical protein